MSGDSRTGPAFGTVPIPAMPMDRATAGRLSRAIAVGGGLDGSLGVEHAAYLAPGGQTQEEHGGGQ